MSNLLEQASIVLSPTAYDDGKVLCVKPSEPPYGDFDFSRNSSATRVNAQGLVEDVQILSGNLVQNPSFSEEGAEEISNGSFTNGSTDWTLGTGWSIGEDKAICIGNSGHTTLTQNNSFLLGKTYKVTFDIVVDSGNFKIQLLGGGADSGNIISSTQVGYTEYISPTANRSSFGIRSNDGNGIGSITNISVKEVGMDWTLDDWSVGNSLVSSGNTSSLLRQDNIYTSTTSIYKTTFKAKSVNGTSVTLRVYDGSGNNFETITITSSDFQDFTLTRQRQGASPSLFFFNNSNAEIEITNISVIEITDDTNLPRINYEGFSYQDALGSEEIVNGDFANGSTDWVLTGGSEITEQGGRIYSSSGGVSSLDQNSVMVVGNQYKLTFDVIATNGTKLSNPNSTNIYDTSTIGSKVFYITAQYTTLYFKRFTGVTDVTITNVSVKEYLGQEVVPNSGCGHLLFEGQSTNLVTYSEDFSQWVAGADIAIQSGYLAPDGNNTAYKVTKTGNSQPYLTYNLGLTATTTRSIYARTVSGTGTATLLSHNSNTNNTFTLTEQWQRFELSDTASSSGQSTFYAADFRGSGTLTEYLVWGANATNDQSYATSYIPTEGTTKTRNQDLCTNGGDVSLINSTEGVLYAEISALADDLTNREITLSDGTTTNYVLIRFNSGGSNRIYTRVDVGGAIQYFDLEFSIDITNTTKIAIRYGDNNFATFINGSKANSQLSGIAFGANTLTELSFNNGGGSNPFFGKTKCLAVFPYLTDTELTELTTI